MSPLVTVFGYIWLAIDYSTDGQFHYTGSRRHDDHMCDDGNEPFHFALVPANHAFPVIPSNPSLKGFRTFLPAFSLVV